METELVSDLGSVHGVGQILLVGEDQQKGISQLVLVEHALQLLTRLNHTVAIVAVDDEDDTLGVLEVMPPQGANFVLTADVPDSELNVLVLDSLDVETCGVSLSACGLRSDSMAGLVARTDGWDGGDDFTKLQLVEDGGLSGSVQSDHQNSHLLLAPEAVEQLRERETHVGGVCRGMWRKGLERAEC